MSVNDLKVSITYLLSDVDLERQIALSTSSDLGRTWMRLSDLHNIFYSKSKAGDDAFSAVYIAEKKIERVSNSLSFGMKMFDEYRGWV